MEVVSGLKNGLENALNGLNIKKISLEDSEKNELVWKSKKGKEDKFNVKQAYEDLRSNGDEDIDSHQHLFFKSNYAKDFWGTTKQKMGVTYPELEWNDLVHMIVGLYNGNSIESIIRRLGLAASVYLIGQERICIILKGEKKSPNELAKLFYEIIRLRLMSLKVKRSIAVLKAQERWNVNLNIVDTHKGVFGNTD
ncbi:hypothetical protein Tco_1395422 [Tanacetum coccineum]